MSTSLALATMVAGFGYVISPGPAFLAAFGLAAARGRGAAARFVTGHLLGDVVWGSLAFAAIIGVSEIGPILFEALGLFCGLYLVWLGARALATRRDAPPPVIGAARPIVTGILFGLTNPKAYPVAVAMYGAIVVPFAGRLAWSDAPKLLACAFTGFVLADALLVWLAGLPRVRAAFKRHAVVVTRIVGAIFVAFGLNSIIEAGRGFTAGRP
jgi:threonine/homoserine/homoserine lactone efflux protein